MPPTLPPPNVAELIDLTEVIDLTQSDDDRNDDSRPWILVSNTTSSNVRSQTQSGKDPKRQKLAGDKNYLDAKLFACKKSIEEELQCSIALELPNDPVFAADGRLYQRAEIKKYYEQSARTKISPYTRKKVNTKVIPALQYKNIIETLVTLSDSTKDIVAQRQVLETTLTENLICPETKELPFNPIVAADGFVYDRSALEGNNVFPTTQHKNLIEIAIKNGFIKDPVLIEQWNEKRMGRKRHESLLAKAEQGDVESMISVAQNFETGKDVFERDDKMVYKWYDRAREAKSILGMASVGEMLCEGTGVKKKLSLGLHYIGVAASRGSDVALCLQGLMCADGLYDCPVDRESAIDLLEKCLDEKCKYRDMNSDYNELAMKKLQELKGEPEATEP